MFVDRVRLHANSGNGGRGAVSEFSTDDVFLNPATDVVPVQQAVYNYLNKRLGINDKGSKIDSIGPGFLDRQGINGPTSDIDWKGYNIIGLPTVDDFSPLSAAVNKNYVDIETGKFRELDRLKNVLLTNTKRADILTFIGELNGAVNAEIIGDLTTTLVSPITTKLKIAIGTTSVSSLTVEDASTFPDVGYVQIGAEVFRYSTRTTRVNPLLAPGVTGTEKLDGVTRLSLSTANNAKFTSNAVAVRHLVDELVVSLNQSQIDLQIKPDTIINADIKINAEIEQSKLKLNLAQVSSAAPTGTVEDKQAASGLSSFNTEHFVATNGWVSLKSAGISRKNLEKIAPSTLLGNLQAIAATPDEITPSDLYKRSLWELFGTNDLNIDSVLNFVPGATQDASRFSTTEISSTVTNNSIVKRSANGSIKISNVDTNGGITVINASGTDDNATPVIYKGQWSPGNNASLMSTTLKGGVNGSIPYQSNTDITNFISPNITTKKRIFAQGGDGTVADKPNWAKMQVSIPISRIAKALNITTYTNSTVLMDVFLFTSSIQVTSNDGSLIDLTLLNDTSLEILLRNGTTTFTVNSVTNKFIITTISGSTVNVPIL